MRPDLGVYLVTEPMVGLGRVVQAAVSGGAAIVQLRDKQATSRTIAGQVIELRDLLAGRGVAVVVNDDLDAARLADGVHVGPDDVLPTEARDALGPGAVVGWSLNDLGQLDDSRQVEACSYLAVSPVFATSTKPDHTEPWGLDGVRAVAGRTDLPVVGIGGIDHENAGDVVRAGAAGVAVVSAICRADDPETATRTLVDVVRDARGGR